MTAAQILILAVLPALLLLAAGWDLASFTIPNLLSIAVLLAFAAFALAAAMPFELLGLHLGAGFCGFAIGFAFFALGWIGGGDAKLFAAICLWLGFTDMLYYVMIASVLGGVLSLVLITVRRWPLPALLARQGWLLRLHDEKAGVPYGVALAAGALLTLPHSGVFLIAAGA